jgi:4-hydroxy-3-polyprenylbenzoate decarboxylase
LTARRIVVAMSGASGAVYGVRLIEVLAAMPDIELHAVISAGAGATIRYELHREPADVAAMADQVHDERNLAAPLASGTFLTDGMVVAPCSIRSLSAIANSANDNLLVRAADVHMKERRRLVLVVRETPLHEGHLRLMTLATRSGAIILPPVPGFYTRPATIAELVDHTVGKVLDSLGVDHELTPRWNGLPGHDD